jgi:serine/threonine protein kinase
MSTDANIRSDSDTGIDTALRHSAVGQVLGNYVVKAVLGEGGMGVVFLAEHQRLGRRVALKRLKERFAKNRKAVKRFVDEAWAIGQIQHANIVKVTDFVLGEHDVYYIMELLEGTTLADELRRSGPLEPHRAVGIAVEVAAALSAMHTKGFVHADIKPSNIFLVRNTDGSESVKLLDFGTTTLMNSGQTPPEDDSSDEQLVTPVYMSPEQANRQPAESAADLYSLGAVLYHMLAGVPPFEAATFAEYVYKHTQESPRPLRRAAPSAQRLSYEIEQVVHRCLEKEPTARFPSARQVGKLLETTAPRRTPGANTWMLLLGMDNTGHTTRVFLAAGGVALLVALATLLTNHTHHPPKATLAVSKSSSPSPLPSRTSPPGDGMQAPPISPKSVTLRIESQPARAVVRRISPRPQILGLTPLVLEQAPLPERWQLQVQLQGYAPQRLQISVSDTVHRRVQLIPETPISPTTAPRPAFMGPLRRPPRRLPPRPVDPRGIIDPFHETMQK